MKELLEEFLLLLFLRIEARDDVSSQEKTLLEDLIKCSVIDSDSVSQTVRDVSVRDTILKFLKTNGFLANGGS